MVLKETACLAHHEQRGGLCPVISVAAEHGRHLGTAERDLLG